MEMGIVGRGLRARSPDLSGAAPIEHFDRVNPFGAAPDRSYWGVL
jgi:hypothetical protein